MTLTVKICGLMAAEHVDAAVEAGAEMTGFVFFPPSPRSLEVAQAASLTSRVPDGVTRVALTVDAEDAYLAAIVAGAGIDALQLHGHENPARVATIKNTYGLPVIKALPVAEKADLAAADAYLNVADMLMFDAKPPKGATRPGGNAQSFDWDLLKGADVGLPWLLAGGLNAANVRDAVARSGAQMVDVSSGVEDAPGRKNTAKIREFVAAAHRA